VLTSDSVYGQARLIYMYHSKFIQNAYKTICIFGHFETRIRILLAPRQAESCRKKTAPRRMRLT
jgi:hypothetical protein